MFLPIENLLKKNIIEAIQKLYETSINDQQIQLQKTKTEFKGDYTLVVFPLLRISKKSPDITAAEIGNFLKNQMSEIESFEIIKGFLNFSLTEKFWLETLQNISQIENYGKLSQENPKHIAVEFSSPNTNKPLHLGHIRNNLLGWSVAEILKTAGFQVTKVNLINDRGIHICKSMLAWEKWGNNETPELTGMKGDHLIGKYYVKFDAAYKNEISRFESQGLTKQEAENQAGIILEAREMLKKWENQDPHTRETWEKMNCWVYKGFEETYKKLGIDFDRIYYESEMYLKGKEIILESLGKANIRRNTDNSVSIDLTADGLDEKILLRSDGTCVYITQDIGTAIERYNELNFDKLIYVVGNEQDYHFQVLFLILKKLNFQWANQLFHLSYGMVELPEGKMKSREGTVVDADDLIEKMIETACEKTQESGKLSDISEEEKQEIYRIIGLGALKYFILKIEPKKNILFNPRESIDFNGNTGTFIQYTYVRIKSIFRKITEQNVSVNPNFSLSISISQKEKDLVKLLYEFPAKISEAAENYSPSIIANYVYDLAREYNQFYNDHSVLNEKNKELQAFRVMLSRQTANTLSLGLRLLGIETLEKM